MNAVWILAWLTFQEARRRSMVLVALALGLLFLLLFGVGLHLIAQSRGAHNASPANILAGYNVLTLAGLYVVHFLAIMLAIVATVDAVSGEISSHTVQTVVARPVARWQVIVGKWIGYASMLALYTSLLCVGILLESRSIVGYTPPNALTGVALIVLQTLVLVSLSLFCGVYVSTLTNGVILFMLYGLAFIGSWVEQIGTLLDSPAAAQVGIVSSLVLPVEALWRLAAYLMQPPLLNTINISPFSLGAVPSAAMVAYAGLFVIAFLGLAVWAFASRDL